MSGVSRNRFVANIILLDIGIEEWPIEARLIQG
jgi:hypothetical protein